MKLLKEMAGRSNVTDLGAFRHDREQSQKDRAGMSAIARLDQAIAAAVDELRGGGLASKEAISFVMGHLGDIVAGYDVDPEGMDFGEEEEEDDLRQALKSVHRQAQASKPRPRDEEKYQAHKRHQEARAKEYEEWLNSPEGQEQLKKVGDAWADYGRQRAENPKEWTGD